MPPSAGATLHAWRTSSVYPLPYLTATLGVRPLRWLSWERGAERPTLDQATALEALTRGALPVDVWGYPPGGSRRIAPEVSARLSRPA
jgi:hypothetical protein